MKPFAFIVARGRSGTTLVRAMLDSHPDMAIPHESHFIVNMGLQRQLYETGHGFDGRRFVQDLTDHWGFQRWGVPAGEIAASFSAHPAQSFADAIRRVYGINAARQGKSRFGDKTPSYTLHMPMLAKLFPEARFIHLIRDGRDVALSYLSRQFGPRTVAENAIYWKRFVESARKSGHELGLDRYCEVRYEAIVDNPDTELRAICEFLDLEFNPQMLTYHKRVDAIIGRRVEPHLRSTHSHRHLHLPPTKGLRSWQQEMSKDDVAIFEALAGDLLQELGYGRGSGRLPIRQRVDATRKWMGVHAQRAARRAKKLISASL